MTEALRVFDLYEATVCRTSQLDENVTDTSLDLRMRASCWLSEPPFPLLDRPELSEPGKARIDRYILRPRWSLGAYGARSTSWSRRPLLTGRAAPRELHHPICEASRASPGKQKKNDAEHQQFCGRHG